MITIAQTGLKDVMSKQANGTALDMHACVCVFHRISSYGEYYGVKGCYERRLKIRGSQQWAGL